MLGTITHTRISKGGLAICDILVLISGIWTRPSRIIQKSALEEVVLASLELKSGECRD